MSKYGSTGTLFCALTAAGVAQGAPLVLPTNYGNGADAEVRESAADQNRGGSTEIATRVVDSHAVSPDAPEPPGDRNSVIYLQFDLAYYDLINFNGSTLRLTFRNNNLAERRITDTDGTAPDYGHAGFQYYGIPGAVFGEGTITYNTAPGITPDGDIGTKDFNSSAMLLGDQDLPPIGTQNWLPVGGAFDYSSAALDAFLAGEKAANPHGVAVIAIVHRHDGLYADGDTKTGDEPADWINFNYLFNPKEQTTLNDDPNYDSNINDAMNPLGSPWSGADNSTGAFSPQLIFVPAPTTVGALLAVPLLVHRRRRS